MRDGFSSEVGRIGKVKMAGQSLKDIGINLSNDFQALVWNYTSGWLTDNLLSSEDWQQIALLFQETDRFEGVINELEVWEKLLTTGFIPLDLANTNNINIAEETTSEHREKIHPYLETWKRYESLVNPGRQISTTKRQSSYTERRSPPDSDSPSLPIADTPSTPKITSQRVVGPGQSPKNHPELETISDNSENVAKNSLTDTIITPNNLGWSKSDSDRVYEFSPVDEFSDIQTQYPQNVNRQKLQEVTEKNSRIQSDSARNSLGMKGLKDLSAFLASQPEREHIIEADLLSNSHSESLPLSEIKSADLQREQSSNAVTYFSNLSQQREENAGLLASQEMSETILLSERKLADIQLEQSRKTVTYFSNLSQQRAENAGFIVSKQMEVETRTEIPDNNRLKYAMVEPKLSSDRTTEVEMEMILDAIAQEINREYRRFYGD